MASNSKYLAELLNANNTVDTADIADGSVTGPKLATASINANNIVDNVVSNTKIVDANIAITKLSTVGGSANQVVKINSGGTALEFGTIQTANSGNFALRTYTSPGTWTKPTDLKAIKVTVIGGGGGGGSAYSVSCGSYVSGSGGLGGAAIKYIQAACIPGPQTVTVGSGGSGGTPTSPFTYPATRLGTAGGSSSFGAFVSATGGSTIPGSGLQTPTCASNGESGAGGVGSGGDINIQAHGGLPGRNPGVTTSIFGAGHPTSRQANPTLGTYGPGRSAAPIGLGLNGTGANMFGPVGSTLAGGDGGAGIVIVEEFY